MRPEILVLGPIQIADGRRLLPPGGLIAQRFLATLVVSINHAVPIDRIVDVVWDDDPPEDPVGSAHAMAARLRRSCGHEAIVAEDHCYRLAIEPDRIDAVRFERAVIEAGHLSNPTAVIDIARGGLDLWRGRAYGELADTDPFRLESMRLEELRVGLCETLLAAEVEIGDTAWAIPMLRSMVHEQPYREPTWRLLITALGAAGRRAEAIEVFADYAATMADLGLEPDPLVRSAVEAVRTGSA